MTTETWLEVAEVARLASITPYGVRKAIAKGAWRNAKLTTRQARIGSG